jgi:hypothetical protein
MASSSSFDQIDADAAAGAGDPGTVRQETVRPGTVIAVMRDPAAAERMMMMLVLVCFPVKMDQW